MKKNLIALFFPIIILLAWTYQMQMNLNSNNQIRVRVRGYDPRDLLAGHYINFQLDLGELTPCKEQNRELNEDTCICFAPESKQLDHLAIWGGACNNRPSDCSKFIKGRCNSWRFEAGIERYSIPEKFAPVLQTVPENSSITIALLPDGNAQVVKFYAGEQELETYAEQKLHELAKANP